MNGMEGFNVPDMAFRVSAEGRIDLMSRDPDLVEAIPIESLMYDAAEDAIKATLTSGASYVLSKSKCHYPALKGSYKSFDGISSANLNMNSNSVILRTPWNNQTFMILRVDPESGEFVFNPETSALSLTYVSEEDSIVVRHGRRLVLLHPEYKGSV
jgi:hypothetical protein